MSAVSLPGMSALRLATLPSPGPPLHSAQYGGAGWQLPAELSSPSLAREPRSRGWRGRLQLLPTPRGPALPPPVGRQATVSAPSPLPAPAPRAAPRPAPGAGLCCPPCLQPGPKRSHAAPCSEERSRHRLGTHLSVIKRWLWGPEVGGCVLVHSSFNRQPGSYPGPGWWAKDCRKDQLFTT